jgi:hypothetical protein
MLVLLKTQRRINGRNVFPTTGLLWRRSVQRKTSTLMQL